MQRDGFAAEELELQFPRAAGLYEVTAGGVNIALLHCPLLAPAHVKTLKTVYVPVGGMILSAVKPPEDWLLKYEPLPGTEYRLVTLPSSTTAQPDDLHLLDVLAHWLNSIQRFPAEPDEAATEAWPSVPTSSEHGTFDLAHLTPSKAAEIVCAEMQRAAYNEALQDFFQGLPFRRSQVEIGGAIDGASPLTSALLDMYGRMVKRLIEQETSKRDEEALAWQTRETTDRGLVLSALSRVLNPLRNYDEGADVVYERSDRLSLTFADVLRSLNITPRSPLEFDPKDRLDPIYQLAMKAGVRVREVELKGRWWMRECGTLLGFTKGNEELALIPRISGGYTMKSSFDGTEVRLSRRTAHLVDSRAYIVYRPLPPRAIFFKDLLRFGMWSSQRDLVWIWAAVIAEAGIDLLTPVVSGYVVDELIPTADKRQLVEVTIALMLATVVAALVTLGRSYCAVRVEVRGSAAVQAAVWDRMLNLPVRFFRNHTAGELAQRSLAISQIQEVLTGSTLRAILSGISSLLSMALLFYYSIPLAAAVSVLIVSITIATTMISFVIVKRERMKTVLQAQISSRVLQFIAGISKFRLAAAERRAFALWAKPYLQFVQVKTQSRRAANLSTVINSMFPSVALAVIIFLYGTNNSGSWVPRLSPGSLIAFTTCFMFVLNGVIGLNGAIVQVLEVVPLYEASKPILQSTPEEDPTTREPPRLTGAVSLSHVSFRYHKESPLALDDIDLKIESGEFVAIVGASGGGKSTIVRMLLGFERPDQGAVYYDGQDLQYLNVRAVRRQCGVVLQGARPAGNSIFKNIVGSSRFTHDDAWEAARLAGIDEDIRAMPMGMFTRLSDGGTNISGGQRQRILIARALIQKPKLIIFDEATSDMDNLTQARISETLAGLTVTRIVVAHRLSTVVKADRILVVDDGKLVEQGTYEELSRTGTIFRQLARGQLA